MFIYTLLIRPTATNQHQQRLLQYYVIFRKYLWRK